MVGAGSWSGSADAVPKHIIPASKGLQVAAPRHLVSAALLYRNCTTGDTISTNLIILLGVFRAVDFGAVDPEPLMYPQFEWDEEIGGKGTILVDPIDGLYKAWSVEPPSYLRFKFFFAHYHS